MSAHGGGGLSGTSDDEEPTSSQSGPSDSQEEGFAVMFNKKGLPIPGKGRNYLIVPGKQKNSRIFQIDNDLYIFEKGKVGKSPDEPTTFYLNCRDYVTQKCKARAHISNGFLTRDPAKPHTCDQDANRVNAEVSRAMNTMKERATNEKTSFQVNCHSQLGSVHKCKHDCIPLGLSAIPLSRIISSRGEFFQRDLLLSKLLLTLASASSYGLQYSVPIKAPENYFSSERSLRIETLT